MRNGITDLQCSNALTSGLLPDWCNMSADSVPQLSRVGSFLSQDEPVPAQLAV